MIPKVAVNHKPPKLRRASKNSLFKPFLSARILSSVWPLVNSRAGQKTMINTEIWDSFGTNFF